MNGFQIFIKALIYGWPLYRS